MSIRVKPDLSPDFSASILPVHLIRVLQKEAEGGR